MAETIELGIVGIKNMGEYDSQTNYEKLNVVTYQGSSYCALRDTTGNLPTDTDYWQLYAEKGSVGPEGPQGPQGPKPVKGVDYYTAADKAELESTLSDDVTSEVTEQLGDLTSATPLVASSTADMTDTTRIYVNTSDGHWYWYDGEDWQDGGVYQAAEDSNMVNIIKNDLIDLKNGLETFGLYSEAKNGTFVNGAYSTDNLKRVVLTDLMIFDKNLNITVESGYRADILKYTSEGVYLTDLAYVTSSYTLEKNTPIKLLIRLVDETGAQDNPDIALFVSKVTFSTKIEERFDKIEEHSSLDKNSINYSNFGIDNLNNYCTLVKGTVDGGVVSTNNKRVTSNDIVNLGREITVRIKDGYRFGYSEMNENGTYKSWSGWKTDTYTIPKDTYFKPLIAKVTENDDPITISEMNNAIVFNSVVGENSLTRTYKDNINILPGGFAYPGTGTVYNGNYPTNRFVTREIHQAPYDLVVGFKNPSDTISYQIAYYESTSNEVAINSSDIFKDYHYEKCIIPKNSYFRIVYSLGSTQTSRQFNDVYNNLILEKFEKKITSPVYNTLLPSKPRIAMHKGYSSLAPENSEAAFTLAGQQNNVYAIECDIRVTSDGKFVIYHNDNLADQTTGTGSVSDHTFSEVTSYIFDKNVNGLSTYPNEHVCSLETYLKTCKKYGKIGLCELKFTSTDRQNINNFKNLIDLIYETGMQNSVIIISFTSSELAKIHSIDKDIFVLNVMMSADNFDYKTCGIVNNYGIDVNYETNSAGEGLTENQIKNAHKLGLIVGVWTPDDTNTKNNYINYGIDLITTNTL